VYQRQRHAGIFARLTAEAIGTFALVFAGTGAIAVDGVTDGALGHVGVSLTFGLVIGVMVYALRGISGAHFNPAVTVGFLLRREIEPGDALAFIAGQLTAAAAASLSLRWLLASLAPVSAGATVPEVPAAAAVAIEGAATFFLMTVILGVVRAGDAADSYAGGAIGGTVAMCALFAGPVTGGSMNPARSFGPAVVDAGAFGALWVYLVGPLLGAAAAVAVERALLRPPARGSGDGAAAETDVGTPAPMRYPRGG
jgi:aquaporin Z